MGDPLAKHVPPMRWSTPEEVASPNNKPKCADCGIPLTDWVTERRSVGSNSPLAGRQEIYYDDLPVCINRRECQERRKANYEGPA